MGRKRYTEEQIIAVLNEAEAGATGSRRSDRQDFQLTPGGRHSVWAGADDQL